jgi:hypothetical protein
MQSQLSVKVIKCCKRWVIDTACEGQWPFSGGYDKPSYRTKEEANLMISSYIDCGYYPLNTRIIR